MTRERSSCSRRKKEPPAPGARMGRRPPRVLADAVSGAVRCPANRAHSQYLRILGWLTFERQVLFARTYAAPVPAHRGSVGGAANEAGAEFRRAVGAIM